MGVANKKNMKIESQLQVFKDICSSIGFEIGTEKFADCVMKLIDKERTQSTANQNTQTQTEKKIDWGKVAEEFNPDLKEKNKRKCVKTGGSTYSTMVCEDVDE